MNAASDQRIPTFLADIQAHDFALFTVLKATREMAFKLHPMVSERFIYGGIMFSLDQDFGGLFAYKNHVSLAFSEGYLLKDPNGLLEGGGKFRRHLKLRQLGDIKAKHVRDFLNQAVQK